MEKLLFNMHIVSLKIENLASEIFDGKTKNIAKPVTGKIFLDFGRDQKRTFLCCIQARNPIQNNTIGIVSWRFCFARQ